jgi:hypothetical protein
MCQSDPSPTEISTSVVKPPVTDHVDYSEEIEYIEHYIVREHGDRHFVFVIHAYYATQVNTCQSRSSRCMGSKTCLEPVFPLRSYGDLYNRYIQALTQRANDLVRE